MDGSYPLIPCTQPITPFSHLAKEPRNVVLSDLLSRCQQEDMAFMHMRSPYGNRVLSVSITSARRIHNMVYTKDVRVVP